MQVPKQTWMGALTGVVVVRLEKTELRDIRGAAMM